MARARARAVPFEWRGPRTQRGERLSKLPRSVRRFRAVAVFSFASIAIRRVSWRRARDAEGLRARRPGAGTRRTRGAMPRYAIRCACDRRAERGGAGGERGGERCARRAFELAHVGVQDILGVDVRDTFAPHVFREGRRAEERGGGKGAHRAPLLSHSSSPCLLSCVLFFGLISPSPRWLFFFFRFHRSDVEVDFPYEAYPCQLDYMASVIRALDDGSNALLESPTGTGKTLCLLCATLAWRRGQVSRLERQVLELRGAVARAQRQAALGGHGGDPLAGNGTPDGGPDDAFGNPESSALVQGLRLAAAEDRLEAARAKLEGRSCLSSGLGGAPGGRSGGGRGSSGAGANGGSSSSSTSLSVSAPPALPTIVYASRTHGQLSQVARELARAGYRARAATLSSRAQSCLNPRVQRLGGGAASTRACRGLMAQRACRWHVGVEPYRKSNPDSFPRDLEETVSLGRAEGVCPYLLSRALAPEADVVLVPYNYLVDGSRRRGLGIPWENAIVVFDEAHNLEGVCADAASFDVPAGTLAGAVEDLAAAATIALRRSDSGGGGGAPGRGGGGGGTGTGNSSASSNVTGVPETAKELIGLASDLSAARNVLLRVEAEVAAMPCPPDGVTRPGAFLLELLAKANITEETWPLLKTAADQAVELLGAEAEALGYGAAGGAGAGGPHGTGPGARLAAVVEAFSVAFDAAMDRGEGETGSDGAPGNVSSERGIVARGATNRPSARTSASASASNDANCGLSLEDFRVHIHPEAVPGPDNARGGAFGARQSAAKAAAAPSSSSPSGTTPTPRTLSLWCFSPGLAMRRLARLGVRSVLLTSGTLSPLGSFAAELGLPFPTRLENPHVIAPDQVWAGAVPRGPGGESLCSSYQRRNDPGYLADLGAALERVLATVPKGVLVFFPSYGVLRHTLEAWGAPWEELAGRGKGGNGIPSRGADAPWLQGSGRTGAAGGRQQANAPAPYGGPRGNNGRGNGSGASAAATWRRGSGGFGPSGSSSAPSAALAAASRIWQRLSQLKVPVVEPREASAFPAAVERFREAVSAPGAKGAVLFAVCRGKASEGIDFSDDACRAVVVTGIPYATKTDAKVLIKQSVLDEKARESKAARGSAGKRHWGDGGGTSAPGADETDPPLTGSAWYVQSAMRAVNQAVGRVIRHKNDHGAVILLDDRFLSQHVRGQLSRWLRDRVERRDDFDQAMRSLEAFYDRFKGAAGALGAQDLSVAATAQPPPSAGRPDALGRTSMVTAIFGAARRAEAPKPPSASLADLLSSHRPALDPVAFAASLPPVTSLAGMPEKPRMGRPSSGGAPPRSLLGTLAAAAPSRGGDKAAASEGGSEQAVGLRLASSSPSSQPHSSAGAASAARALASSSPDRAMGARKGELEQLVRGLGRDRIAKEAKEAAKSSGSSQQAKLKPWERKGMRPTSGRVPAAVALPAAKATVKADGQAGAFRGSSGPASSPSAQPSAPPMTPKEFLGACDDRLDAENAKAVRAALASYAASRDGAAVARAVATTLAGEARADLRAAMRGFLPIEARAQFDAIVGTESNGAEETKGANDKRGEVVGADDVRHDSGKVKAASESFDKPTEKAFSNFSNDESVKENGGGGGKEPSAKAAAALGSAGGEKAPSADSLRTRQPGGRPADRPSPASPPPALGRLSAVFGFSGGPGLASARPGFAAAAAPAATPTPPPRPSPAVSVSAHRSPAIAPRVGTVPSRAARPAKNSLRAMRETFAVERPGSWGRATATPVGVSVGSRPSSGGTSAAGTTAANRGGSATSQSPPPRRAIATAESLQRAAGRPGAAAGLAKVPGGSSGGVHPAVASAALGRVGASRPASAVAGARAVVSVGSRTAPGLGGGGNRQAGAGAGSPNGAVRASQPPARPSGALARPTPAASLRSVGSSPASGRPAVSRASPASSSIPPCPLCRLPSATWARAPCGHEACWSCWTKALALFRCPCCKRTVRRPQLQMITKK